MEQRAWKFLAGVMTVMVVFVLPNGVPAARADTSVTEFSFVSAPGDFIGRGGSGTLTSPNWTFTIQGYAGYVRVDLRDTTSFDDWSIDLAAPLGGQLHPGIYTDAQRAVSRTGTHPGLDVSSPGRGCDQVFGSFVIRAISATSDGHVNLLDARFSQNCENATAPTLVGAVKYQSPPPKPVALISSNPVTVVGEPVTLIADTTKTGHYADARRVPVRFLDGTRLLGIAVPDATGVATLTTARLKVGTHVLRAAFDRFTSATATQTVRSNAQSYWFVSGATDGPQDGGTASYARPDDNFAIGPNLNGIAAEGLDLNNFWWFSFYPPAGQQLQTGTYSAPTNVDIFGGGACVVYQAAVTVNTVERDSAGGVSLVDLSFVGQCNYTGAGIIGHVHYQAGVAAFS